MHMRRMNFCSEARVSPLQGVPEGRFGNSICVTYRGNGTIDSYAVCQLDIFGHLAEASAMGAAHTPMDHADDVDFAVFSRTEASKSSVR